MHRKASAHLGFGVGVHYCLGASMARMEGRVAIDEILSRFPEWEIDMTAARMVTTSTVRGWETLPGDCHVIVRRESTRMSNSGAAR